MYQPKWCIFYDFHTMPGCPEVGENFDFELWTDKIKECGVDFIVFAARCNLGNAYYDTRIGYRHPALKYDLFGKLVDACNRKKIAVSAYLNGGLSHEECLLRPEFLSVHPDGQSRPSERNPHFFRQPCPNSPYGDHVVRMVGEIAEKYDIKGFFIDCLGPHPCVCPACMREMKEKNIDWRDNTELLRFSRFSINRFCEKIATEAKAFKPELLLFFNGVAREDQLDCGTYAEIESIPTAWGYDNLPLHARYFSNFPGSVINMNGRFHRAWGDFGGIRTSAALEYDIAYGLANGLSTTVGDHFHPRGDINETVFALIKKLYRKYQSFQEYFDDAKQVSDIAVLADSRMLLIGEPMYTENYAMLKGFFDRLAGELKLQCSLYTDKLALPDCELLILPDNIRITDQNRLKIGKHLQHGGKIIASYRSGLENNRFLPEWGVEFIDEAKYNESYLQTKYFDMPIAIYDKGLSVKTKANTQVVAEMVSPLIDSGWDGEHYNFYTPPDKTTGEAAVTLNKQVGYFSFPFFKSYAQYGQIPMRRLFDELVQKFLPHPVVQCKNMPSFSRIFVTAQKNRRIVHLLSFVPQLRGKIQQIEEPVDIHDSVIRLRIDGQKIKTVFCPQSNQALPFECDGTYCQVNIPHFRGYCLVVFQS